MVEIADAEPAKYLRLCTGYISSRLTPCFDTITIADKRRLGNLAWVGIVSVRRRVDLAWRFLIRQLGDKNSTLWQRFDEG